MPKQREIQQEITFKVEGTFESKYAAERWLHVNGYSYGSTCAGNYPVAILHGPYNLPQKWKNFWGDDKDRVDGIMTSTDWREGEVKVLIYK